MFSLLEHERNVCSFMSETFSGTWTLLTEYFGEFYNYITFWISSFCILTIVHFWTDFSKRSDERKCVIVWDKQRQGQGHHFPLIFVCRLAVVTLRFCLLLSVSAALPTTTAISVIAYYYFIWKLCFIDCDKQ